MSGNFSKRLIIFTRYPEPGKTKTRMIPELGAEGAADLQRRMTDHLVSKVKTLIEQRYLSVEIRFQGGSARLMRQWQGSGFSYHRQGRGDIGRRMLRALADGFQDGHTSIVIIGADIPDISPAIIQHAFDGLQKTNLVLGPAADGGYYLIGIQKADGHQAYPELFEAISWGTNRVLAQTIATADRLGIGYALLDTLADVDRPEDLKTWNRAFRSESDLSAKKHISIIIPTLNEADVIEETITRLPQSKQLEILVVDGGSRDGTAEMARELGARVLSTAPSKAEQMNAEMNAGAAEAQGEVLLFLHADTRLPEKFEDKVLAAVARKGYCAGAFTLGVDSADRGLRFIERVANWRARFFKMPYGDQALFVDRQLFHEIGGFADYPIMEDFELVRRLKKKGKIAILPESVKTSPRRWQNLGIFKTWFLNQIIIAAYFLGIPPQRLALWYRREKGRTGERRGG